MLLSDIQSKVQEVTDLFKEMERWGSDLEARERVVLDRERINREIEKKIESKNVALASTENRISQEREYLDKINKDVDLKEKHIQEREKVVIDAKDMIETWKIEKEDIKKQREQLKIDTEQSKFLEEREQAITEKEKELLQEQQALTDLQENLKQKEEWIMGERERLQKIAKKFTIQK